MPLKRTGGGRTPPRAFRPHASWKHACAFAPQSFLDSGESRKRYAVGLHTTDVECRGRGKGERGERAREADRQTKGSSANQSPSARAVPLVSFSSKYNNGKVGGVDRPAPLCSSNQPTDTGTKALGCRPDPSCPGPPVCSLRCILFCLQLHCTIIRTYIVCLHPPPPDKEQRKSPRQLVSMQGIRYLYAYCLYPSMDCTTSSQTANQLFCLVFITWRVLSVFSIFE